MARGNEIALRWVLPDAGVAGNEFADSLSKEAAEGPGHRQGVPDAIRWQVNLPHLTKRAIEGLPRDTPQWITAHVCPKRRYRPPGGPGLRRKVLREVRKPIAGRYCQLLSGHAAIGPFLHERMTGPLRLESSECRRCGSGRRGSRHHLFTECQAMLPQIRRL